MRKATAYDDPVWQRVARAHMADLQHDVDICLPRKNGGRPAAPLVKLAASAAIFGAICWALIAAG